MSNVQFTVSLMVGLATATAPASNKHYAKVKFRGYSLVDQLLIIYTKIVKGFGQWTNFSVCPLGMHYIMNTCPY